MNKFLIKQSGIARIVETEPKFIGVKFEMARQRPEFDGADHIEIEVAMPHDPSKSLDQTMQEAREFAAGALTAAANSMRSA